MTLAEIDDTIALMRAAGRRTIPISLTEWREYMTTKAVKGSVKTDAKGKTTFKPADTAPFAAKIARQGKAATLPQPTPRRTL